MWIKRQIFTQKLEDRLNPDEDYPVYSRMYTRDSYTYEDRLTSMIVDNEFMMILYTRTMYLVQPPC
jgi:hypothetical protein